MTLERKVFKQLLSWKIAPTRKPLILRGARQVGKSTLARELGKTYPQFIEVNLEKQENFDLFETTSLQDIVEILFLKNNFSRTKETLIFLDEIQESPKAVQQLRYFYEEFPEIHVISAGSLLEFTLHKIASFPVGRVEQMAIHPFDFEEFLMAIGQTEALKQWQKVPINHFAHGVLLSLFHQYTIIGGMPEIVKKFVEDQSYSNLSPIYNNLWQGYKDDVEKYAQNATERRVIRHILETAHFEKDRIKFEGFGQSNYRSREVGEAFRSLDLSRVIQLIYPTTATGIPILADLKRSPRLQYLDTGILNFAMGIQAELIGISDFSDLYKGKIIQQVVSQQLQALHQELHYKPTFWVRENNSGNAEIDLIYIFQSAVFPIEIKSGKQGKLRSLHQFVEQADFGFGIRMCANNFSVEKATTANGKNYTLMNLPYYLAGKLPEYLTYLIDNE
jgi:uncharacterized protein